MLETQPRYTLLIPAYNEAGNIGPLLENVRKAIGPEPEIIVIDDGSSDTTVQEVNVGLCTLISHEVNQGKGAALRTGIRAARGKYIVFIDGDGQDNPAEIELIVKALENGADVAMGSRFLEPENKRYDDKAVRPVNEFGNKMITAMVNLFFGGKLTDACASLRGYRAEVLKAMAITSNRYEIESEMVIRCLRSNQKMLEVPVSRYERVHGISNLFDVPFGRTRFAFRVFWTMAKGFFLWRT